MKGFELSFENVMIAKKVLSYYIGMEGLLNPFQCRVELGWYSK